MHTELCTALSPEKLPRGISCGFAWHARDAGGNATDLKDWIFPKLARKCEEDGDDLSTNNNESA